MTSEIRALSSRQLEFLERRLEQQVAGLRPTTAAAAEMLRRHRDKLALVRAEQERRTADAMLEEAVR
jgi:hypothetical protein